MLATLRGPPLILFYGFIVTDSFPFCKPLLEIFCAARAFYFFPLSKDAANDELPRLSGGVFAYVQLADMIFTPLAGKPVSDIAMSAIRATSSACNASSPVDTTTLTLPSPMNATQS